MKKRTKHPNSGRKKGLPTKVKRIFVSIEPAVDDLMKKEETQKVMDKEKEFEIDGIITTPDWMSEDYLANAIIEFFENSDWSFTGKIVKFEDSKAKETYTWEECNDLIKAARIDTINQCAERAQVTADTFGCYNIDKQSILSLIEEL